MNRRKLQSLIDASVKAHNAAHAAEKALSDYCESEYGCVPGDVDADTIIDACLGGCGQSSGMDAEEFDEIMRELAAPSMGDE